MHPHAHTYVYVHIHVHILAHVRLHTLARAHTRTHTWIYLHICVCMSALTRACRSTNTIKCAVALTTRLWISLILFVFIDFRPWFHAFTPRFCHVFTAVLVSTSDQSVLAPGVHVSHTMFTLTCPRAVPYFRGILLRGGGGGRCKKPFLTTLHKPICWPFLLTNVTGELRISLKKGAIISLRREKTGRCYWVRGLITVSALMAVLRVANYPALQLSNCINRGSWGPL